MTPSEKISERPSTKKYQWQSGSAGLVFSTVVTLLVLPTIYVPMDDFRNWAREVGRAKVVTA